MILRVPVKLPPPAQIEQTLPCVAIDPGKAIGIAYFEQATPELMGATRTLHFDSPGVTELANLLSSAQTVVLETFELFPWKAGSMPFDPLPAVQVLGYVKITCMLAKLPLKMQTPAQAKSITDTELKRLVGPANYPAGNKRRHERDALRHLMLWLINEVKRGN